MTDSVLSVDPLVTQGKLEDEMRQVAEARLQKDIQSSAERGSFSDSRIGIKFVQSAYQPFVQAVKDFVYPQKRKIGRQQRAAGILRATGLEAETIAYLFVKGVFNQLYKSKMHKPTKRVSFCFACADIVHTEWRIRHFATTDGRKALIDKIMKDMEKRTYPKEWKLRTIRHVLRRGEGRVARMDQAREADGRLRPDAAVPRHHRADRRTEGQHVRPTHA